MRVHSVPSQLSNCTRRGRFPVIVLLLLLTAETTGCWWPRSTPDVDNPVVALPLPVDISPLREHAGAATLYTVGPYDRLEMLVWRNADLTTELLVKDDGTVFLPAAGHVHIAGLTLRRAQEKLTRTLGLYFENPQLDLKPAEIHSKRFYVLGDVNKPGGYPIYKPISLREAVSLAGGTTPAAVLDGAYLSRRGKVYPIDLTAVFTTPMEDIYMQPGDTLYVPSQSQNLAYVLGEVARPSAVPVSAHGLGVLQAVAQAGGFTIGANDDEIAIIRRHGGEMVLHVVDVEAAMKYGEGNPAALRLLPGDVVWVPPTGLANWNRALALINPTLDTLLIRPLGVVRDYFIIDDIIDGGD